MANKSKSVNDIVSQTARALGSGKSFGGWTDTVEEDYRKHVKKQHASMEREKKETKPLVIDGPNKPPKIPNHKIVHEYDKDGVLSTRYVPEGAADPLTGIRRIPTRKRYDKDGVLSTRYVPEGTLTGAAAGAMIGSAFPVVGTALGAIIGGGLGMIGSMSGKNKKVWKDAGKGLYGGGSGTWSQSKGWENK